MVRTSADNVSLVAGGVAGVGVGSTAVSLKYAGTTKLTTLSTGVQIAGDGTFSGDVTAGSLSKTSDTTISILTAAESNSVLKFRESTDNYGFTQQYQGTGNYFELLRHNNSGVGNTV